MRDVLFAADGDGVALDADDDDRPSSMRGDVTMSDVSTRADASESQQTIAATGQLRPCWLSLMRCCRCAQGRGAHERARGAVARTRSAPHCAAADGACAVLV
jgi:hypothetical protein